MNALSTAPLINVRVSSKRVEALDICSFELVASDSNELPAFSAGSHIDVNLPNGLTRQYSLCNSPGEKNRYVIAVLKESASRGGSRWMHESLAEGQLLQIGAPRNQFSLVERAEHSVLIAGGIGITPILSMAYHLAESGNSFELHYTARSAERMAFAEQLRSTSFCQQVRLYASSSGDSAQKLDLGAALGSPKSGTHVYACGPKGLIDAVFSTSSSAGWKDDQLHREFFSAAAADQSSDHEFKVKLASSGQVVSVPRGTTVVEALADVGIEILTSCEQGICGTCVTRILEGVPDHRDIVLTPQQREANDQFTPCCSRSKTSVLVLDL